MVIIMKTEGRVSVEELIEAQLGKQGLGFKLLEIRQEKPVGGIQADFFVLLETPPPGSTRALLVIEVKSRGEPSFLAQAIARLKAIDLKDLVKGKRRVGPGWVAPVVVAPYITERGRDLCVKNGINYMDHAGNVYLRVGTYFIERRGHQKPIHEKRIARNLFAPKASRIARALLEEPKRVWTLNDLSKATGLSIGHAHAVVKRLEENQFVSRNKERRIALDKPGELLDAWSDIYDVRQNGTHAYFSFEHKTETLMKKLAEAAKNLAVEHALTLHAGASLIAPFTRFNDVHAYVRWAGEKKLVKALDLRPTEVGGNVYLVVPRDEGVFYRTRNIDGMAVVCNTQLYLDLANYPARGAEQAEFLRKEKILY
jgi:hypothetical protein